MPWWRWQTAFSVRKLTPAARARSSHGKSVLALAIRWVLDQGPTIALWGARRPDQLRGIGDAYGWRLSAQDLSDIDALLARHVTDPVGPEFMAPSLR